MSKRDSGRSRTQSGSSAITAFFSSASSTSNSNNGAASSALSGGKSFGNSGNLNRTSNPALANSTPGSMSNLRKSTEKPFQSLYERTMTVMGKLYSLPDFEYYLFPGGLDSLLTSANPEIDPIAILWRCFRLGAPLCHLLNKAKPKQPLTVPDVSGVTDYSSRCKDCVFRFLKGVSEELSIPVEALFTISELGKDDTNGLVKVMDVVELVLEEIDKRGLTVPPKKLPFATKDISGPEDAKDNRSKSIAELLSTERSYVQSLQELQNFRQELTSRGTISNDLIHTIFSNLSVLLDHQRRFLFALEATLALPSEDQNIGSIFIQYEENFECYTPMCASYSKAIAAALENEQLLAGGSINPGRDLQGYLIKPIQRICRYPLLLKEIVKLSDNSFRYYEELKEAEAAMKRVTDKVNEVQRMEENRQLKDDLLEKIEDLQGLNPDQWGDLLLYDKFPMIAKDVEQLYHIYLFELLVLCCKESSKEKKKRSSKPLSAVGGNSFDIKGKIYASSISDIVDVSRPKEGRFEVKVFWNEMEESFMLKCRNAEQADLWTSRISACASGNTTKYQQMRPTSDKTGLVHKTTAYKRAQSYNANMHPDQNHYMPSVMDNSDRAAKVASLPASARPQSSRSSGGFSNQGVPASGGVYRRESSNDSYSREIPKRSSSNMGNFTNLTKSPSMPLPPPPSNALPEPPNSALPVPTSQSTGTHVRQRSATAGQGPPSSALPAPPSFSGHQRNPSSGPPSFPIPPPPSAAGAPRSALPPPPSQFSAPPSVPLPSTPMPATPEPIIPMLAQTHLAPPVSRLPMPPTVPSNSLDSPRVSAVSTSRPSTVSTAPPGGLVKMKTHYGTDIFILAVSANGPKFDDILDRIERKIRISGAPLPDGRRIKLKYRDEDGDFITINGDDDIEMAFDMARRITQNGAVVVQAE